MLGAKSFLDLVARYILGSVRVILLRKFTQIVAGSLMETKSEVLAQKIHIFDTMMLLKPFLGIHRYLWEAAEFAVLSFHVGTGIGLTLVCCSV